MEENKNDGGLLDLIEQEEMAAEAARGLGDAGGVHSIEDVCEDEMKRFVAVPCLKMTDDPLLWWKNHQGTFPILARLAKTHLPVQATPAPAERVFSAASRLLSSHRTRMDPDFAGKAFFVSSNWEWFEKQQDMAQVELDEVVEEEENEVVEIDDEGGN